MVTSGSPSCRPSSPSRRVTLTDSVMGDGAKNVAIEGNATHSLANGLRYLASSLSPIALSLFLSRPSPFSAPTVLLASFLFPSTLLARSVHDCLSEPIQKHRGL